MCAEARSDLTVFWPSLLLSVFVCCRCRPLFVRPSVPSSVPSSSAPLSSSVRLPLDNWKLISKCSKLRIRFLNLEITKFQTSNFQLVETEPPFKEYLSRRTSCTGPTVNPPPKKRRRRRRRTAPPKDSWKWRGHFGRRVRERRWTHIGSYGLETKRAPRARDVSSIYIYIY